MVFTKDKTTYTHYTKFNESLTNLSFSLRLWDPDSFFDSHAKLLLSLFPLPLTGEEFESKKIAIEIFISNTESGLTVGNKDMFYEPSVNVLKSSEFTTFFITWGKLNYVHKIILRNLESINK